MKRGELFPVADRISLAEQAALGVSNQVHSPNLGVYPNLVRAEYVGEFREPKAGEWYLSGAKIEAYKTKNDLSTKYHIAKLVRVERVEYWRKVEA